MHFWTSFSFLAPPREEKQTFSHPLFPPASPPGRTTDVPGQDALRGGKTRGGVRALRAGAVREASPSGGVVLPRGGADEAWAVAGGSAGVLHGRAAGAGGRRGEGGRERREVVCVKAARGVCVCIYMAVDVQRVCEWRRVLCVCLCVCVALLGGEGCCWLET